MRCHRPSTPRSQALRSSAFELSEGVLDGVEVKAVGRQVVFPPRRGSAALWC